MLKNTWWKLGSTYKEADERKGLLRWCSCWFYILKIYNKLVIRYKKYKVVLRTGWWRSRTARGGEGGVATGRIAGSWDKTKLVIDILRRKEEGKKERRKDGKKERRRHTTNVRAKKEGEDGSSGFDTTKGVVAVGVWIDKRWGVWGVSGFPLHLFPIATVCY